MKPWRASFAASSLMDAVAIELGLKEKLGDGYVKARNGSKKEFVDAVLGIKDFEYRGLVPKMMRF